MTAPQPQTEWAPLDLTPLEWTPLEWACCHFPAVTDDVECADLDLIVQALHRHIDTVTEDDTTALSKALHVAHILVTMQGPDGGWPQQVNLRTGDAAGPQRTISPISVYRRMNAMLGSSEFSMAIAFAESRACSKQEDLSHPDDRAIQTRQRA